MTRIRLIAVCALFIGPAALRAQTAADSAWTAGNHQLAERLFAQRLAADSNDIMALRRLATLRAWAKAYDESLTLYDRALRLAPADDEIVLERARTLAWAGRYAESLAVYERVLYANPENREALLGRARVLSWSGRTDSATVILQNLIARDARDVEAFMVLGSTLRSQGRDAAGLRALRNAVALDPNNTEARALLADAEAAMDPRIVPVYTYEADSDENRMQTATMTGRSRPADNLEARVDWYVRFLEGPDLNGGIIDPTTSGATFGLTWFWDPGWSASVGAGTSGEAFSSDGTTSLRASVATPRWWTLSGVLAYNRAAFDYTAALAERGVRTDQIAADATARLNMRWHLIGNAAATRYTGEEPNQQISGSLAATYRWLSWLTVGVAARAFGFEKDRTELQEGYFNPDFFGLLELTGATYHQTGKWLITTEAAPGYQQIESDGERSASFRVNGRAAYTLAPGRQIGLSATYANSGLQQLSPTSTEYNYMSLGVFGNWTF